MMTIYTPRKEKDLLDLLYQARQTKQPIFTHQAPTQEGITIDWSDWNSIIEIDEHNLTATVQRGATLGMLAKATAEKGLKFAPYTPDLADVTIGEFYQQQLSSLTSYRFGLPKLHVMGLDVFLPNGEIIRTGGKTVKNVTGYDMNRFYISSRDTIAIPLTYTVKLYSQDQGKKSYIAVIKDPIQLTQFIQESKNHTFVPSSALCWSKGREILLFIELKGMKERVQADEQKLFFISDQLNLKPLLLEENPQQITWQEIKTLRKQTTWSNCFKIPPKQTDNFVNFLSDRGFEFWFPLFQGSFNLILEKSSSGLYEEIQRYSRSIKGVSNWYLDYQYHVDQPLQTKVWKQLKEKFDPDHLLNPI